MKPLFLAVALSAAVGTSGAAQAAFLQSGFDDPFTVDFREPIVDLAEPVDFGRFSVTSTGDKNDGLTQGAAGLGVGPDLSGLGDEVDGTNVFKLLAETITLTFAEDFLLRSVSFDLAGDDGGIFNPDPTTIKVTKNGSELGTFESSSTRAALVFVGGERVFGVDDTLTFSVDPDLFDNDSYAIAGLSEVPLPAAAWLFLGGLGAAGAYGRYRRREAPAAHT